MADMFEEYVHQLKEPLSPAAFRDVPESTMLNYNVDQKVFEKQKLCENIED